jgi:hypothetical protein
MSARHALRVVSIMKSEDEEPVTVERFERRIAEVEGKLRLEISGLRHDMTEGFGKLRTEIADRNSDQLKWLLLFFVGQTAALAAVLSLFR